MSLEVWVRPSLADAMRRKRHPLRMLTKRDIDRTRTVRIPLEGESFTVAADNGDGHSSHYYGDTYAVTARNGDLISFRKERRKRP